MSGPTRRPPRPPGNRMSSRQGGAESQPPGDGRRVVSPPVEHVTILEHIAAVLDERDRRYLETSASLTRALAEIDVRHQQRFEAQTKAVEAAFLAQQLATQTALASAEKAVNTAMIAAEKAVAKAEVSAEKRFESVNEFRAQLTDQAATFMPRSEAEQRINAMSEKIDLLRTFAASTTAHGAGVGAAWGYLIGAVGLIGAVIAVVVSLGH
jgi:hypothetical protein